MADRHEASTRPEIRLRTISPLQPGATTLNIAGSSAGEGTMSRHLDFAPHGVIPAVILPFDTDLEIDEAAFRAHLRHVGAVEGLSAITINAHSTEVASSIRAWVLGVSASNFWK